jgi:hypothetical protein
MHERTKLHLQGARRCLDGGKGGDVPAGIVAAIESLLNAMHTLVEDLGPSNVDMEKINQMSGSAYAMINGDTGEMMIPDLEMLAQKMEASSDFDENDVNFLKAVSSKVRGS